MKTVKEIRLANLERLVREAGTLEEVARRGDTSAVYLSQIRNGAIDQKTDRPRAMGSVMARRLEKGFSKPVGWMDTAGPAESNGNHGHEFDGRGGNIELLPVVGSVRVDREEFIVDPNHAGGHVAGSGVHDGYALLVRGDGPARSLRDGQYMVIERNGDPAYSDYCIFHTRDGEKLIEIRARRDDGRLVAEVVYSGDRMMLDPEDVIGVDCVVAVVSASRFRPPPAKEASHLRLDLKRDA